MRRANTIERHDSSPQPDEPAEQLVSPALHDLLADVIQREHDRLAFVEGLARRAQILGHDPDWYVRVLANPFLTIHDVRVAEELRQLRTAEIERILIEALRNLTAESRRYLRTVGYPDLDAIWPNDPQPPEP